MRIEHIEIWPVRVAYRHAEISSLVVRDGVTDVVVKVIADNGLVGWGESTRAADAAGIASAVEAMRPIVLGRDPFDMDAIARDVFLAGAWQFQPMTGNFAFAGLDMALWDLCAKACGQPLYRLFGGAMRDEVDYFCYLRWERQRRSRSSAGTAWSGATRPSISRSASTRQPKRRCSRRSAAR